MTSKFTESNLQYRGKATRVGKKQLLLDPEDMWKSEEALTIDERRQRYHCRSKYVKLENVLTWEEFLQEEKKSKYYQDPDPKDYVFPHNNVLNKKLSLWQGDITRLEIDAIVNAANRACLGGGGVDGSIHTSAGDGLYHECLTLGGCPTGFAKITRGYDLPSKYVIHTVGPIISISPSKNEAELLASAYQNCLNIIKEFGIKTVAFCGVSTGVYNYPRRSAARTALTTIRNWLEKPENLDSIERIIFCTFTAEDHHSYLDTLPFYFPPPTIVGESSESNESSASQPSISTSSELLSSFPLVPSHTPSENDNQGVLIPGESKPNEIVNTNDNNNNNNNSEVSENNP